MNWYRMIEDVCRGLERREWLEGGWSTWTQSCLKLKKLELTLTVRFQSNRFLIAPISNILQTPWSPTYFYDIKWPNQKIKYQIKLFSLSRQIVYDKKSKIVSVDETPFKSAWWKNKCGEKLKWCVMMCKNTIPNILHEIDDGSNLCIVVKLCYLNL